MLATVARNAVKARSLSVAAGSAVRAKHTLPDLPYDYNALEPVISAEIMKLHHDKHHRAYVTNLNIVEEKIAEAVHKQDTATVISLQNNFRFNAGGHINHTIFWSNLTSPSKAKGQPEGELATKIKEDFGSFENFVTLFNTQTAAVQGSGWGWLGFNKAANKLTVIATPNQDPLQPVTGLVPLLGVDVWEHAYYLQYKNARPDYLKEIWKIINWDDVSARFSKAKSA
eukprot:Colp12_sorted_trinity150504_noHs@3543